MLTCALSAEMLVLPPLPKSLSRRLTPLAPVRHPVQVLLYLLFQYQNMDIRFGAIAFFCRLNFFYCFIFVGFKNKVFLRSVLFRREVLMLRYKQPVHLRLRLGVWWSPSAWWLFVPLLYDFFTVESSVTFVRTSAAWCNEQVFQKYFYILLKK